MRALYDKRADALQIYLLDDRPLAVDTLDVGHGSTVGVDDQERPVEVEVLGVTRGLEGLDEASRRYGLDREQLEAVARAAIAAADREVTVVVAPAGSAA